MIFSGGHPEVTGIAQVVDIGARHLAQEGNALYRVGVSALLRGADGSNGQCAVLVGACDQALGVLLRDSGHSTGGRQEDDVGSGLHKGSNVLLCHNVFRRLRKDPRRVHLACRQDDAVPDGFFETAERLLNGCVGDTDAGVAREQDKINAQLLGPQSVLHRGTTPGGHGPHGVRLDLRVIRHGLQIDADGPPGELFQQADGLPRFHRRQAVG